MKNSFILTVIILILLIPHTNTFCQSNYEKQIEERIDQLIEKMAIEEQIGQMSPRHGGYGNEEAIGQGLIGSILN